MDVDGAVCIVTGASSGIGAATARRLSKMGAAVVLAARRAERLDALAAQLPWALPVPTDVTQVSQVEALAARTLHEFGRIDALVNCAGQGLHVRFEALDPKDLQAVFELNVVGPLATMQAVLPAMVERGTGAVVNVSSANSLRVRPGSGGYAATKAALNMLSQVGRVELAAAGITISLVYPSFTATEFPGHLRAGRVVRGGQSVPPDLPDLVAQAITYALETGEAHVLVDDPPLAITPGSPDWGDQLARPFAPRRVPDAPETTDQLELPVAARARHARTTPAEILEAAPSGKPNPASAVRPLGA